MIFPVGYKRHLSQIHICSFVHFLNLPLKLGTKLAPLHLGDTGPSSRKQAASQVVCQVLHPTPSLRRARHRQGQELYSYLISSSGNLYLVWRFQFFFFIFSPPAWSGGPAGGMSSAVKTLCCYDLSYIPLFPERFPLGFLSLSICSLTYNMLLVKLWKCFRFSLALSTTFVYFLSFFFISSYFTQVLLFRTFEMLPTCCGLYIFSTVYTYFP